MSKLSRGLTIKIEPTSKGKYGVSYKDATTRSDDGRRVTEGILTRDAGFSRAALMESIKSQIDEFHESLEKVDPGDLFTEKKSPKGRLDKRA